MKCFLFFHQWVHYPLLGIRKCEFCGKVREA